MKSLDMEGPFELTQEVIDSIIPDGIPGNYAYGYVKDDTFYVQYVGRFDTNLKDRISHGIGQYESFKVSLASSTQDAFKKECINYCAVLNPTQSKSRSKSWWKHCSPLVE